MARPNVTKMLVSIVLLSHMFLCSLAFAVQTIDDAKIAIRTRQYSEAFQILSPLANSGKVEAQYLLASFYARGRGIEQDYKLSAYWLTQAAQQEHSNAQYDLAALYEQGRGVSKNIDTALSWYQKSAALGNKKALAKIDLISSTVSPELTDTASQLEQLYLAIRDNDLDKLESLLSQPIDINHIDNHAHTPLFMAVEKGHRKALQLLIKKGANANYSDQFGENALFRAAKYNHSGISQDLLDHGAQVNAQNAQGNTALHMAVRNKKPNIVEILLNHGAKPNQTNNNGDTALDLTNNNADDAIVKLLRAKGGVYNTFKNSGQNADLLVKNLLQQPKNTDNVKDPYANWPSLNLAAWRGQGEIVESLIKASNNIDSLDNEQHTPLSRATWQGHLKIMALLLSSAADPNHPLPEGLSILGLAVENNHPDAVKMLLNAGAKIAIKHELVEPLLVLAARKGFESVALELINNGADINQMYAGKTALMWAAQLGQEALFKKLLQKDASFNDADENRNTALMLAVTGKHLEAVKILLGLRADISTADADGNTPLAKASKLGFTEIVRMFLDSGANVNVQNNFLNTPLMIAATEGHTSTVEVLLTAKPALTIRNKSSLTALMLAAQGGHLSVVKLLLDQGVDIKRRNKEGKNAQQLAKENQHDAVASYIDLYQQDRSLLDIFN